MSTPLTDIINDLNSKLNNQEKEWVQFIYDHYTLIRENSEWISIEPGTMKRYRYRPEDYLEHLGKDKNLAWIMLLINQIPNRGYFEGLDKVLVPDQRYIEELRSKYETYLKTLEEE